MLLKAQQEKSKLDNSTRNITIVLLKVQMGKGPLYPKCHHVVFVRHLLSIKACPLKVFEKVYTLHLDVISSVMSQ